jgi:hypothetical protein
VAVGLLDVHVPLCVSNADADALDTMVTGETKAIKRLVKA